MFRIHESTPDSESLVLTDHKNNHFTKIGGTKKKKIHFYSSNFQQISALETNLTMKFHKFCAVISVVESTTHNVSKTLSCIKIEPLELAISSIEDRKTCEIDWNPQCFNIRFHTFLDVQLKISSVPVDRFWCKIAFWKRY